MTVLREGIGHRAPPDGPNAAVDAEAFVARPIRVLQLGSPNGMFGAERWIMALLAHLPRARVHSSVGVVRDTVTSQEPELLSQARAAGFDTVCVEAIGRFNPKAVAALRAVLRERRIDVLHTHFYKGTLLGALAIRGTRCRLLATPHGWSTGEGWKLQAYEWLERLAFARADAVSPLSPDLERGLRRLPWVRSRLAPIPNGVDLGEVTGSDRVCEQVSRARYAGEFVVGYLGQLIPRKRVDTLIEAFARLDVGPKRLFVVGDGPERERLERLAARLGIADSVDFAGFRSDRLDYLRGFDTLVLPSALEGIPRCLMEGMAARRAIVASDIEGTREVIRHGVTGLTFPVDDVDALAASLARLAAGRALRDELGARAHDFVTRHHSAEAMAASYLGLYVSITGAATSERAPDAARAAAVKGSRRCS